MARPRRDQKPARQPTRKKLTFLFVQNLKPEPEPFNIKDTEFPQIELRVYPSGKKTYRASYRLAGRVRWATIGNAMEITLKAAQNLGADIKYKAKQGIDVVAERKAQRSAGTFAELADDYLVYAKRKTSPGPRQGHWWSSMQCLN
jgi:hypothetical protein